MVAAPAALAPQIRRLRAPNPSPMTLDGTNGYIIEAGAGALIAIDPGPDDAAHVARFEALSRAEHARYIAILVTHGHPDHYPGAAALAALTGAPIIAHPAAAFAPDRTPADDDVLTLGTQRLRVLHAPGHAPDHLVFALLDERDHCAGLFTGDVIIGSGTVVVAPPRGDMRAYQHTLHRLRNRFADARAIYGGHGPERTDVVEVIDYYIAHREARERALLHALSTGPATVPCLTATLYTDVDPVLRPAAARQILAYLVALEREGRITAMPRAGPASAAERALLDPDLSRLAEPDTAGVLRAELGYDDAPGPLMEYALV